MTGTDRGTDRAADAAAGAAPGGDDVRRRAERAVESEVDVLWRRLRRVVRQRATEVADGLSPAAYLLLTHLVESGPVRQVDLVEALGSDKGGVSRLVQHLVDADLVERSPDPDDGRACRVAATDLAHRRLDAVDRRRREAYHARLAGLPTDELVDLARLLGRYNAAVGG